MRRLDLTYRICCTDAGESFKLLISEAKENDVCILKNTWLYIEVKLCAVRVTLPQVNGDVFEF